MEIVSLEIHQTRRFAKRLSYFNNAGKIERIVADRARQIIADLQKNLLDEKAECKRTIHGELRLNDCRKYDLSCGFRLIALKRDNRLIFTYIGSHDDCQQWIENNRNYQDSIKSTAIPLVSEAPLACPTPSPNDQPLPDEYEEQLRAQIDDQVLRSIFAGLCKIA